ncbi:protein PflB [Rodentibacter pneumotropicus]|uniref:Protein PflB n=1 Tax=Rodentibacter pneumotropicus TaxID=758 RepID=A0A3S4UBR6_9PAST|nr:protein PflB [Rodentibacter pneumotropicus]
MSELSEAQKVAWTGFTDGDWQKNVNVRDFIQKTILRMKAMILS